MKKSVPRNFAKFTGKHLCQSLSFNFFLLKKKFWHRGFPVNFAKISKNTFFTEYLRATASDYSFLR